MAAPDRCPSCLQSLPVDAPRGLCPACLFGRVMDFDLDEGSSVDGSMPTLAMTSSAQESVPDGTTASIDPDEADPADSRERRRPPVFPESIGRYRLERTIGRGGVGVVIRGRDVEIGRRIALKVLREEHVRSPEMVRRFVEEAQVCGQLVHPAIVPVYEMGTFPDGRPYFVMKLVEGRTLGELLRSRGDPTEDLPRILSIFDQVCQAMAYAHSQGVIHRDLKPMNVMVGAFGEVQTMDWGMAKLLGRDEGAEIDRAIRTAGIGFIATLDGIVKGTLAYMPPEQARGEVDRLDERADVFALGAILCMILTGRPPYVGRSSDELLEKAAAADLSDALASLQACRADAELLDLTRSCLSPDPNDRPRDAGAVAAAMTAYFEGVRERLRLAELDRVAAEARAEGETKQRVLADELADEAERRAASERKRRRATVALAASLLLLFALCGVVAFWLRDREAVASRAFDDAQVLQGLALADVQNPAAWSAAVEAAKRAEGLLTFGVSNGSRTRAVRLRREVEQIREFLESLADLSALIDGEVDRAIVAAAYAEAFRKGGIDMKATPAEVATQIRSRPRELIVVLAMALDDWAFTRRILGDHDGSKRINDITRLVDSDPWRNHLRDALDLGNGPATGTALLESAQSALLDQQDAISLDLLGLWLTSNGRPDVGEMVLRAGNRRFPRDFRLLFDLAYCLEKLNQTEEAIRYYFAARAIRPESAHALGHLLNSNGEIDAAIEVFRDLNRLRPGNVRHQTCLGVLLAERGKKDEAAKLLEPALADDDPRGRPETEPCAPFIRRGSALKALGRIDEAIAEFRRAAQAEPDCTAPHVNLGHVLHSQGKYDLALAEYQEVVRLDPYIAHIHKDLAMIFRSQGKLDAACTEYRLAIQIDGKYYQPRAGLAQVLEDQGKNDEALAELAALIRLDPKQVGPYVQRGVIFRSQRKFDQAVRELRMAAARAPDFPKVHYQLASTLKAWGKMGEAVDAYRESIKRSPDLAEAYMDLGELLRSRGDFDESLAIYRKGHEVGTQRKVWRFPSAQKVAEAERLANPVDVVGWAERSFNLRRSGRMKDAANSARKAIQLDPKYRWGHQLLGWAYLGLQDWDRAIAAYRAAIEIETAHPPDLIASHEELAMALKGKGLIDEAIVELRLARAYAPPKSPRAGELDKEIAEAERIAAQSRR